MESSFGILHKEHNGRYNHTLTHILQPLSVSSIGRLYCDLVGRPASSARLEKETKFGKNINEMVLGTIIGTGNVYS